MGRVQVLEHFHRDKVGHKKVVQPAMEAVQTVDDEVVEDLVDDRHYKGSKMLAPYQVKVMVSLKNHKQVIFANPEKHAQHTMTEATDVAVDGMERWIPMRLMTVQLQQTWKRRSLQSKLWKRHWIG